MTILLDSLEREAAGLTHENIFAVLLDDQSGARRELEIPLVAAGQSLGSIQAERGLTLPGLWDGIYPPALAGPPRTLGQDEALARNWEALKEAEVLAINEEILGITSDIALLPAATNAQVKEIINRMLERQQELLVRDRKIVRVLAEILILADGRRRREG